MKKSERKFKTKVAVRNRDLAGLQRAERWELAFDRLIEGWPGAH